MTVRPGRNELCHCGSGNKYKKCHLEADDAARIADAASAAAVAASTTTPVVAGAGQPSQQKAPAIKQRNDLARTTKARRRSV